MKLHSLPAAAGSSFPATIPPVGTPLAVQSLAQEAARVVLPALRKAPGAFRELGDQATRAVTSVALNLAEGAGRAGKDKLQHYRIAYGSALEASAGLEMLAALGVLPQATADAALGLLDRTRAMTWRLLSAAPKG
jgi:four helix bundle protein